MLKMVWSKQKEKTDSINNTLRNNLAELVTQVTSLPIKNGNFQQLLKAMAAMKK
jgi:hypothetical protein